MASYILFLFITLEMHPSDHINIGTDSKGGREKWG